MPRERAIPHDPADSLGRLALQARRVVEGFLTGIHASPYHGFSAEFADHRKYTPGDPLRDLDWSAYARTDRYYVKRYKEETNLRCALLVDASKSMDFAGGDGPTKLDYACQAAAALAYLCHRQRDAVGLTVCAAGRVADLPPSARPAHLGLIFERLETLRAVGTPDLPTRFEETARRLPGRGLVIVLSDLLDGEAELTRALKHLRHRRHDALLIHLLDPAEIELPYGRIHDFVDLETGQSVRADPNALRDAYREEIAAFRDRYRRFCNDTGIEYVPAATDTPLPALLAPVLARRAGRGGR